MNTKERTEKGKRAELENFSISNTKQVLLTRKTVFMSWLGHELCLLSSPTLCRSLIPFKTENKKQHALNGMEQKKIVIFTLEKKRNQH